MSARVPVCRSCSAPGLELFLSLGSMPLANSLLTKEDLDSPEPAFPLELAHCSACSLVQILETIPPDTLFREYLYFSSFSDTVVEHARQLAQRLVPERRLSDQSLVVEVASNDGYLLQFFQAARVPVLGIEPARNVAKAAIERGIPTISEFFGEALARELVGKGTRADVILGNNVLAHVPDLNGFARGVALLLKDDGVAMFEAPYVKDMIDGCEFDTIYHEHLAYYSLTAVKSLFERHGLSVVGVERTEIHGGSLRVSIAKNGRPAASVGALLEEEAGWRVGRIDAYRAFAERVQSVKSSLRSLLGGLKEQRKRIAGYGAAAKGTVLLNYCGIGPETIDFIVDRSPHKQGRYVPGVRLPIFSTERLLADRPDYVLLLAWNFSAEIARQQSAYLEQGGRFVVPVPEPRILQAREGVS
jgi:SAM-dependent methyltransferase